MGLTKSLKANFSSVNPSLLRLKLCYFLILSVVTATMPFLSVMPTQMVSYQQLAIIYACSPLVCIGGPTLTGFIGDRLGNYKALTIISVVLAGVSPFGVLWLFNDHQSYCSLNNIQSNSTDDWVDPGQQAYTFPLLLFFRLLCFYSMTSATSLLDACAIAICKKERGDFGRQKLWGEASLAVVPFVCGILVDRMSVYLGYEADAVAFYAGAVFAVMVIPLIMQLDLHVERNEKSVVSTVKEISGMMDFNVFLLVSLVIGIVFGFHVAYRPVFATELQASKTLIGVMLSVSGIGSMVFLAVMKSIIEKIGEANTVIINLVAFGIRSVVYYFLQDPLIMTVMEVADGFCGFIAVVAASYYCAAEAPPGMLASLNGVVMATVFGAGSGIGTSVGSVLISEYGLRTTYLFFSYLTFGTGFVYLVVYHLFLKKIRQQRNLIPDDKDCQSVIGFDNPSLDSYESGYEDKSIGHS